MPTHIKAVNRTMTKKQWDRFIPLRKLATLLRGAAKELQQLGEKHPDARGRIRLGLEVGKPTGRGRAKIAKREAQIRG